MNIQKNHTQCIKELSLTRRGICKRYLEKHPKASLRDIGYIMGISHETVRFYKTGKRPIYSGIDKYVLDVPTLGQIRQLGRELLIAKCS